MVMVGELKSMVRPKCIDLTTALNWRSFGYLYSFFDIGK